MKKYVIFLVAAMLAFCLTQEVFAQQQYRWLRQGAFFRFIGPNGETLALQRVPDPSKDYPYPPTPDFVQAGPYIASQNSNGSFTAYGPNGRILDTRHPLQTATQQAPAPQAIQRPIAKLPVASPAPILTPQPIPSIPYPRPVETVRQTPAPEPSKPQEVKVASVPPVKPVVPVAPATPTPAKSPEVKMETKAASAPKPNASPPAVPIPEEFTIKIPVERIAVGNSIEINGRKYTKKAEGLFDNATKELYRGEAWAVVEIRNGEISAPKRIMSQRPHLKELALPM